MKKYVLNMGSILSFLGYPDKGRTDDPDSTTGLTSRERYLVKSSWKEKIMASPTESGAALLVLYFEKFPKAKELFPFKNIPTQELSKNIRFKAHCNAVIYAVASVVDAVDSPDLVVSILQKTGKSHVPRGVSEQLFLQLKETILELFGKIMKPDEVEAWKKAADVIFSVICGALKEEAEKH